MYLTASLKMPLMETAGKKINLYGLEPVFIEDGYIESLRQNQMAPYIAIESKPILYKKKYYKGCLSELKTPKILIMRYGGIGDIQWVLPAIRELKKRKPEAIIRFACFEKDRELVYNCDFIDEFVQTHFPVVADIEWADYVLDFFDTVEGIGEIEAKYENPININEDIIGYKIENKLGFYKIDEFETSYAKILLKENGVKEGDIIISMPLVASSPYRSWNRQDEVISKLLNYNPKIKVVIYAEGGNNHSEPIVRRILALKSDRIINLKGKTTLRQMVAIANESHLILSNDTGMVPLMAVLNKKVVALYTTVPKATRISEYPTITGIQAHSSCSPCFKLGHECENGIKCVSSISANEVTEKIIGKLNEI